MQVSEEIHKQLERKLEEETRAVRLLRDRVNMLERENASIGGTNTKLRERIYQLESYNTALADEGQKLLSLVSKHQRLFEEISKLLASAQ